MATVTFRLRNVKNNKHPILVYVSISRGNVPQSKTGFSINPKDWSFVKKKPKQNDEETKQIYSNLLTLENYITSQLNNSNSKGEDINKQWLDNVISDCFNRVSDDKNSNNHLTTQIQHIVDNAKTHKIRGKSKLGLSDSRVKGYKTFKSLIENYEKHIKVKIRLIDINPIFLKKFTKWLIKTEEYSMNYSGKTIDNLKAVCINANERGIKTNKFSLNIESFKEAQKDKHIVTLSFDELNQIKDTQLKNDYLINARKWLLIGSEIGQRGNDLLNISQDKVRKDKNDLLIDVYQEKGEKTVTVGISKEYVADILINDFPRKISIQKLNNYIKELCKVCKINTPTKGKKRVKDRNKLDTYPKHELICTHTCRRSFATNYYKKIPTAILMEITGHTRESMFLEYVGKPKDRDENAKLFIKLAKEIN